MAGTPVEIIKEKLDLVEFLRGYLALQPAGKNFKALCPFHHEKTASFMVSPERQTWHCFGCGAGGDVFTFLMRQENVEFGEALKILAERAGVELKRLAPGEYKYAGLLYELNDAARDFFRSQLEQSAVAKKYLAERGLRDETIREFELGWAPNAPDALTVHLVNLGYNPEDVVRAGLVFKTDRGLQVDRFRGRIMFPIHNHLGKVIAFTGRILPQFDTGEMGKYVNSPETPIFNKSKVLYGLWKAKSAIRETGAAFLVEGQMDMLMSWQAGVKYAVATSGTALTPDHLRALRRFGEKLIVSFDSDEAGFGAAERAIALAEAADFEVRVAAFGDFKDPAEAAAAGAESFGATLGAARPAPEFYFDRYLKKEGLRPGTREYVRSVRAVLAKLKNMASAVERSFWMKRLSERLGVPEKVLAEEADRIEMKNPIVAAVPEEEPAPKPVFSRRELVTQCLLAAAVAQNNFEMLADSLPYVSEPYREILHALQGGVRRSPDPASDELVNLIVLQAGEFEPKEIEMLKRHLYEEHCAERRRELTAQVKAAEMRGDEAAAQSALRDMKELPAL